MTSEPRGFKTCVTARRHLPRWGLVTNVMFATAVVKQEDPAFEGKFSMERTLNLTLRLSLQNPLAIATLVSEISMASTLPHIAANLLVRTPEPHPRSTTEETSHSRKSVITHGT